MRTTPLLISGAAAAVLLAGCGSDRPEAPSTTVTVTAAPSTTTPTTTSTPSATTPSTSPAPSTSTAAPTPSQSAPAVPVACGNDDLTVAAGPVGEDGPARRVDVTFTNTSAQPCVLVGYPGADLVTAAGGVLVHVERRPQNSAPHLELQPGEKAIADVQSSAFDTATYEACRRIGTLVVTAPNTTKSHLLEANLPICGATISSVG